ncbi:hypothetical protein SBOR_9077 [Sclerotinia borealis F-4128]|uniref:GPI anchored protein n=1 Tax=Sclerotinia borealis (strain F-4128) TaxID=1432307 RepID=W9C490_SCLBF|nr:hypothetical protein SBOR_9077 [Sclerotinia borealis F-4128]
MHAVTITSFAAALMGTVVAAQTSSVVDLYLIGFDSGDSDAAQPPFVGSIIASDATATTYSITCGSTTAAPATTSSISYDYGYDNDCGVPENFTFTQGPSTIGYAYSATYEFDVTMTGSASSTVSYADSAQYTVGCVLSGTSSAVCSATDIGTDRTTSTSSAETTTLTGSNLSTLLSAIPVTITAGPTSASDSAARTTMSASSPTGSASSSGSGSPASTGGMPMITAKAQWAFGGAAAAMVMAAL